MGGFDIHNCAGMSLLAPIVEVSLKIRLQIEEESKI
jgi:hypothetical protein